MAILKEEREKARQLKAHGGHTSRATKKDESEESVDLSKEEVECLYPVNIRLPALPVPKENNLLSNMGSDELMYFPDVVSVDEEEALWLTIQKQAEADGWVSLKGRQSMMLGEHKDAQGNHISQRLPMWLENISSHLPFFNLDDEKRVNHVLINQYDAEGSIAFHTDGPSYLDRVCILSLGGPVILSFRERLKTSEIGIKEDKGDVFQVKMEPRSLLLFSGTVYSDMLHGIDPQTEVVDSKCLNRHLVPDPKQNVKGERISLTLRHALK